MRGGAVRSRGRMSAKDDRKPQRMRGMDSAGFLKFAPINGHPALVGLKKRRGAFMPRLCAFPKMRLEQALRE